MKDQRPSIFTIERRKNFPEAFIKFFEDLQSPVITSTGNSKIYEYLNYCLRYWPHRCGATGIDDYLKDIGVDITKPKEDKDLLLILELLINLLHWAPRQDFNDDRNTAISLAFKKNDVENETDRLIRNAEYLLEQCCNMMIREQEDDEFPKYFITKRNARVDSAVFAVPELSDALLGYMDVRNSDDIEYKKSALITIYGYMEQHRNEYKALTCGAVSEEFFTSMNSFGIRHNTKSQVRMRVEKKKIVCDKLFMMAVYVLQTGEVNEYKNELKGLREKQNYKDKQNGQGNQ